MRVFQNFRNTHGLPVSWPIPRDHLILFVAHCFDRGCAAASISAYLSGLRFYHRMHDWPDPLDYFIIRKMLEGCKKSRPGRDHRAPITHNIFCKLLPKLESVCYSAYEAILFKTAFSLAYYGLFRISEVLQLAYKNIVIEPDRAAVRVTIESSKTSHKPVTIRLPRETEAAVCPVLSLHNYVQVHPSHTGYLLVHRNGRLLNRTQFAAVLHKTICMLGLSQSTFQTHSFRIGRATELSIQGYPDSVIKQMGRWRSAAYKTYIRTNYTQHSD